MPGAARKSTLNPGLDRYGAGGSAQLTEDALIDVSHEHLRPFKDIRRGTYNANPTHNPCNDAMLGAFEFLLEIFFGKYFSAGIPENPEGLLVMKDNLDLVQKAEADNRPGSRLR